MMDNIMTHNHNITYIAKVIGDLNDTLIDKIYKQTCAYTENNIDANNENITSTMRRSHKTKYIVDNIKLIDVKNVKKIYNYLKACIEAEKQAAKIFELIFDTVNLLLVAAGYEKIDNLCDFKNIERNMIITDACRNIIMKNIGHIFDNDLDRKIAKCKDHVTILRNALCKIGYSLKSYEKIRVINKKRIYYLVYRIEETNE